MNQHTFKRKTIHEIWDMHKDDYDGMFVIAVVTDDMAKKLQCRDACHYTQQIRNSLSEETEYDNNVCVPKPNGDLGSSIWISFTLK